MRIAIVLLLAACGSTTTATTSPSTTTSTSEGEAPSSSAPPSGPRCLPVVGFCGCSYACGFEVGEASPGDTVLVRTDAAEDAEPVEARLERWCQPEGQCRDAYVRPLPCGGLCTPTRRYDACHFEGDRCAPAAAPHGATE